MLRLIRSKHMVRFIQELITNRSFKLHVKRQVKNIHHQELVPQSSVLAPMFFNIDTSDIPHTASTLYIYADDIYSSDIPHTASTLYIYADDIDTSDIPHTASTLYIYADDIDTSDIPHTASTLYIYADDIDTSDIPHTASTLYIYADDIDTSDIPHTASTLHIYADDIDTSDIPHTASTLHIYADDIDTSDIPHTASTLYIYADDIDTSDIPHTASTLYIYADDIDTSDIPHTASTLYIYADDIALVEPGMNYADIQQTFTNGLTCLELYLQLWGLRRNVNKTVSSCFHLTNCLANHQMEIGCGEKTILTTANPKYIGVTFDRSLTYSKHLPQLSKKVNARCDLLGRLASTTREHTLTFFKNQQSHLLLLRPSIVRQCCAAV